MPWQVRITRDKISNSNTHCSDSVRNNSSSDS